MILNDDMTINLGPFPQAVMFDLTCESDCYRPFVNQPFNMTAEFVGVHQVSVEHLKIHVSVKSADGLLPEKVLEILHNSISVVGRCAKIDVQMKFLAISNVSGFVLDVQLFDVSNSNIPILLARSSSNPIHCIQYQIVIEDKQATPYVWYKDEGGKDNCLEYWVKLVDANRALVANIIVPLRMVLMYEDGREVHQQHILALSHDSKACINESGFCDIKFRINEVSNRHMGKRFQLSVRPDLYLAPGCVGVGEALSLPIDVKSKSIPSKKQTHGGASKHSKSSEDIAGASLGPSSSGSNIGGSAAHSTSSSSGHAHKRIRVAEAAAAGTCVRASVPLARDVAVEAAIAAGVEMLQAEARKEANGLGIDVESVRQRRKDLVRLGNRALNVLQVWNGSAFEVFNDIPTAIGGAVEEGLLLKIEELKRSYKPACVPALRFIEDYFHHLESPLAAEAAVGASGCDTSHVTNASVNLLQQLTSTDSSSDGVTSSD